jgi:hypothetical protein
MAFFDGLALELPLEDGSVRRQIDNLDSKMKKPHDLKSMSTDELWSFYELVAAALAAKMLAEKATLINDCFSFA